MHAWAHDSFVTALNRPLPVLLAAIAVLYLVIFVAFAGLWWAVWAADDRCLSKADGSRKSFGTAFLFSVATTQTIGYGNTAPNDCGPAYPLLIVQVLVAIVTEAAVIGVIFAKISHPQHRARTIGISEVAVIARRDGILKLMFRVADIQATPVVQPSVKAFLYTWGAGRTTAEGEFIPVRIEELQIGEEWVGVRGEGGASLVFRGAHTKNTPIFLLPPPVSFFTHTCSPSAAPCPPPPGCRPPRER